MRRQQHFLSENQIRPAVVGQLVVDPHRDRVEGAGDLAVAAEDAARHVDLVDSGVALAGRDLVVGRVLGGDHPDAVGRAGGRAERTPDALLQAGVLELVKLVTAAEARVDGRLLLGVLERHWLLEQAHEGGAQALERCAERAVGAADATGLRTADNDEFFVRKRVRAQSRTTTKIAVTSALTVASGSRTFQPNDMSWS